MRIGARRAGAFHAETLFTIGRRAGVFGFERLRLAHRSWSRWGGRARWASARWWGGGSSTTPAPASTRRCRGLRR
eukprot:3854244-Pyramimonas_sp.AAC.1